MKNTLETKFLLVSSLLTIFSLTALIGCKYESAPSLYDPNWQSKPQPVIDSVFPPDSALAAVDTIIITGRNFSPNPQEDIVFFNAGIARILSATSTQLALQSPVVIGDSVQIRVSVIGAELFSEPYRYKLKAAVAPFGSFLPSEAVLGLATDASGILYASIVASGSDNGIDKLTPDGVRTSYAPRTSGAVGWTSLKFGPGGYLYAARNIRAMYRFAPGGGPAQVWVAFPVGVQIYDFDFDQSKNVWAGGNNNFIYLIKPDKSTKTFPFAANIHSLRVFNNYLYFAARKDSVEKVWRARILADSLGTPEVYFDFSAIYGAAPSALAITFSSEGDLYIGNDAPGVFLLIVHPNGSYETPYTAYTATLSPSCKIFAWGSGSSLFASTGDGKLLRIDTKKTGAPYYGTQ